MKMIKYRSNLNRVRQKLLNLVSLTPLMQGGMSLQLAGVVTYSLSYVSDKVDTNHVVAQIASDRALKARLARIE